MFLEYPLDQNKLLMLTLQSKESDMPIHARLHSRYSKDSKLVRHILPLLTLDGLKASSADGVFTLPAGNGDKPITLSINGNDFAQFIRTAHGLEVKKIFRSLSAFETRIIGRAPQDFFPRKDDFPASAMDGERDQILPITDLHTHLSGQVPADKLLAMGLDTKHPVFYPTAALDMLNIEYDNSRQVKITKRVFLPLAHLQTPGETQETAIPLSSLAPNALAALKNAMSLSPEGQNTFEDLEKCYYFREPFNKDIRLLPDMLRVVAENYRQQGIKYAVLSSNAILDPAWLKVVHEVMPELEKQTGVALRFKAGLPRNLDEAALSRRVEQYKVIAASPYILGPDFLGYEINKTSRRHGQLDQLASWMKENQPDDILQIHAGENAKNPRNVIEALQIADKHGIRLDVGHALYGIDEETFALAQKLAAADRLICQCNPDSNLALNNIDFPEDVPIRRLMDAHIPCILGSDGAALYLTDARQTATSARLCGVTSKGFQDIRKTEEGFIARQAAIFTRKQAALPPDFFETLPVLPALPQAIKHPVSEHSALPPVTAPHDKRPVFFAGKGGKDWDDATEAEKEEFRTGVARLLVQLDPDEVYFVRGRTKTSGINFELEKVISAYNSTHTKGFDCITMLAESEQAPAEHSAHFKTLELSSALANLPSSIVGFLKQNNGYALFAGGKNFTRDFILKSAEADIPFGLMQDMAGASRQKSEIYMDHAFTGAKGMVEWAHDEGLIQSKKWEKSIGFGSETEFTVREK